MLEKANRHLRMNTHYCDVKSPKGLPNDKYSLPNHDFNEHARFTLIEQVRTTTNMSKETIRQLPEEHKDFWMMKLQTILPHGFNIQLDSAHANQIRVICS